MIASTQLEIKHCVGTGSVCVAIALTCSGGIQHSGLHNPRLDLHVVTVLLMS